MSAPDDVLMKAADSIAAGDEVDWQGLQKQSPDAERSRILGEMQVLERIATFLRNSESVDHSSKPSTTRQKAPMPSSWMHFRPIEVIGEGGFGCVYRARDTKLQTDVALKLIELPPDREVRPAVALKEARLLARVRHDNVVRVAGADIADGRVGIWMELIEGQTLSTLLGAHGPFGAHEAALIGVDLCRALAAVHAQGLVHGDVKTRNVMRESGGRTVLMDFGAGKDLWALRVQGSRDTVAGTPLYLAPEVFSGMAQSKVTDIYSLGVLLFHLVTNDYPVKGKSQAEVEESHARGERLNLRDARPGLPAAFVAVIERALSRNGDDRFQSAGTFEAALADFLGQRPIPVPPEPSPWRSWRRIAAVSTALLLVGAATLWAVRRWTPAQPATPNRPDTNAPPVAASYRIDPSFYKVAQGGDTRLRAGDRVAPGDAIFMRLRVSAPTYVYVVNEDEQDDSLLLFPLPGLAVENPIAADTSIRVPGTKDEEISWTISSPGNREHFLVFASPERMLAFEEMVATLPRPVFGKPVTTAAKIPKGTLSKLRSVGGLTSTPIESPNLHLARVFTSPLGDREETARGLWVRQLTVENPAKAR